MSENTKIEWCDHTFNPWEGCQKVGPGCDNCYAEARNARFSGGTAINWGPGAPRRRTSESNWNLPTRWNAQAFYECLSCGWRGKACEHGHDYPHRHCPNCRTTESLSSARARVFCASLADVFDNAVDPAWRADLFALIAATPKLDWLLLTKRIGNAKDMIFEARKALLMPGELYDPVPLPNVWLGATIVNQDEADRDIPKLLAVPAARRFLSMEPLLGLVDIDTPACLPCPNAAGMVMDLETGSYECCKRCDFTGLSEEWGIDWVIVGGESGPGARPMHPDWARSLRDQCEAAGVPFLFKQWGEWTPGENVERQRGTVDTAFLVNGCWSVYPLNLATDGGHIDDEPDLYRVGKQAAGRHLDGRTWDGVPA